MPHQIKQATMTTPHTVEQFILQANLDHRRRVEAIYRRGLTGRALDSALAASAAKRARAIQKFRATHLAEASPETHHEQ